MTLDVLRAFSHLDLPAYVRMLHLSTGSNVQQVARSTHHHSSRFRYVARRYRRYVEEQCVASWIECESDATALYALHIS